MNIKITELGDSSIKDYVDAKCDLGQALRFMGGKIKNLALFLREIVCFVKI